MQVTDFLGAVFKTECLGCSIGSGEVTPPGGFIRHTEHFVLHQDPETPIAGFLIVASVSHLKSLTELSSKERIEMTELLADAVSALKVSGIAEEVTVIQEERSAHFHIWIFPRRVWMQGLFKNSVSKLRAIMSYAKQHRPDSDEEIISAVNLVREYVLANQKD